MNKTASMGLVAWNIVRLAALMLFLVSCGGDDDSPDPEPDPEPTGDPQPDDPPEDTAKPDCARSPLRWTHEEQIVGFRNSDTVPNCTSNAIGHGTASLALRDAPTNLLPNIRYEVDGTEYTLDQAMETAYISGLLVAKGEFILLERYGLEHDENSRWTTFSVTKSVLSMLIGAAILDDHIEDVADPVTDYVSRLEGTAYDGVTIRNLLQMASGVGWDEDYTEADSDVGQAGDLSGSELHDHLAGLSRVAEPGTRFNYNTGDANLLGDVLRAAIDDDASSYLSEKIWQPLMEHRATWATDGDLELGGCCIHASLRDMARIGWLAWNDGVLPDDTRVLPENWMRDSTTPATAAPPAPRGDYGYLWWIDQTGGTYSASGLYGQSIVVDPENELVIVTQGATPAEQGGEAARHLVQLTLALVKLASEVEDIPSIPAGNAESDTGGTNDHEGNGSTTNTGTAGPRTGRTLVW